MVDRETTKKLLYISSRHFCAYKIKARILFLSIYHKLTMGGVSGGATHKPGIQSSGHGCEPLRNKETTQGEQKRRKVLYKVIQYYMYIKYMMTTDYKGKLWYHIQCDNFIWCWSGATGDAPRKTVIWSSGLSWKAWVPLEAANWPKLPVWQYGRYQSARRRDERG